LGLPGHEKGRPLEIHRRSRPLARFDRTVQDIKQRNAETDPNELQSLIDGAVREVRVECRAQAAADKA
jgi:hypothetical protein